jgi:subtilase family serine protease
MGHAGKITITTALCGLALGATALGATTAATAGNLAASTAKATAKAAANAPDVVVRPDVIRFGTIPTSGPTTTKQCEQTEHVACYTPAQVREAYGLNSLYAKGIDGKGTTIAIVDSYGSPTIKHDLSVFDAAFGIPAPPSFKIITPVGKIPAFNPKNSDMAGWAGETTLDVEWAHTIAPGANILLVESPVSETEGTVGFPQIVKAEKYVLSHYHVAVISQSFSATEQTFPSKASIDSLRGAIIAADKDRVTMLAASGDSGVANTEFNGSTYYLYKTVNWEPSDPLVTGVGGTQLHLDAAGNHTSPDSVWNDTYNKAASENACGTPTNCQLAGGGGTSVFFSRPGYQDGVADTVGDARGVPDISMSAACNGAVDLYASFPGLPAAYRWSQECGTSEATPLFAGIVALASQYAGHSLGLINPAIYQIYADHDPGIVPVTSGNNTVTLKQSGKWYTIHGYRAAASYNLATGVGTVDAQYFVPELAALAG